MTPRARALAAYSTAIRWLDRLAAVWPRASVSLLHREPYLEVIIHASANGTRRLWMSKVQDQQQANAVVMHMLQAAHDVAKAYGITIQTAPPPEVRNAE